MIRFLCCSIAQKILPNCKGFTSFCGALHVLEDNKTTQHPSTYPLQSHPSKALQFCGNIFSGWRNFYECFVPTREYQPSMLKMRGESTYNWPELIEKVSDLKRKASDLMSHFHCQRRTATPAGLSATSEQWQNIRLHWATQLLRLEVTT